MLVAGEAHNLTCSQSVGGSVVYLNVETVTVTFKRSMRRAFLFVFQCHEASIAIYSSMENQRLSHWVFVSAVAMIICLIIYSLTGQTRSCLASDRSAPARLFKALRTLTCVLLAHIFLVNEIIRLRIKVKEASSHSLCCRSLWVPDVREGPEGRYFNVVQRQRHPDARRQAAVWSFHHHHLSHHRAAGQVSHTAFWHFKGTVCKKYVRKVL